MPSGFPAFRDVYVMGELRERAELNFERLHRSPYTPEEVFAGNAGWPADLEGRLILGLVTLGQALHREPRYLKAILDGLPERLNERGYIGPIHEAGVFDEQQLAGHNWLIRGLCEHWLWTGDSRSASLLHGVIENLFLPARGHYQTYPARPEDRAQEGEAYGHLAGRCGDWYCSSDIGCAFIALDGLAQASALFPRPELMGLLDEMIEVFLGIDFVGLSCQTHATLSGVRGLIRYYEAGGGAEALAGAKRIWGLYASEAMTETYANYNWFGRPHSTEPCAIVDSFMTAMELWRMTRDPAYLETAQHIRYNAFVHGQRPNGGFGCNTCAGAGDAFVTPVEALYEAWWCCTMRGAEGLARAIQYAWFQEDGRVCQLYGGESVLRADAGGGEAVLAQRSAWPYGEGLATDVASAAGGGDVELGWFIPSWVDQGQAAVAVDGQNLPLELDRGFARVALPLARGSRAEVRAPAALRASGPVSRHSIEDHQSLRRGPLVLTGGAEAPESVAAAEEGEKLRPLGGLYRMTEAEARRDRRRVLFTR